MNKLKIDEKMKAQVRRICLRHGISLCFLFGSRVEGCALPDSDLDIAIVLRRRLSAAELLLRESIVEEKLQAVFSGVPVQLVTIPSCDARFNFEVISKGVLLYSESPLVRAKFVERVLREWHDWEPVITAFEREMKNAIRKRYARV